MNQEPNKQDYKIDDRLQMQDIKSFKDPKSENKYVFLSDSYHGTGGYETGNYLIPFPREVFYNNRRSNAVYKNLFRQIIDAQIVPVFNHGIARESTSDLYNTFTSNADNAGSSLQMVVEDAIYSARIYDLSFVVMDNVQVQPDSVHEAVVSRALPYIYTKDPQEVKSYTCNRWGQLESITFCDETIKVGGKDYKTFRTWTTMSWSQFYEIKNDKKMDTVIIAEGTHGLGVIPVIPVLGFARSKSLKAFPRPVNLDLAYMCHSLYCKETEVQTLEQYQCFSILYVQDMNPQSLATGPTSFLNLSDTAKIPPGYISPDANHLTNMVKSCDRLAEAILHLAGQRGVIAVQSAVSGISKEWDFRSLESVLKKTSSVAENLENKIAGLFKLYTKTEFESIAEYPRSFSPTYTQDLIKEKISLIDAMPPEPLKARLWRDVAVLEYGAEDEVVGELDGLSIAEDGRGDVVVSEEGNGYEKETST